MITLTDAIRKTADALGISIGAAKVKIIDACHARDIQAYWRGEYAKGNLYAARVEQMRRAAFADAKTETGHVKSGPLILCREWAGADIDLAREVLILANGERKGFIDLDSDDFQAWLARHAKVAASDRHSAQSGRGATQVGLSAKLIDSIMLEYLDGTDHPSMGDAVSVFTAKGYAGHRPAIREAYARLRRSRGDVYRRGRPNKSAVEKSAE